MDPTVPFDAANMSPCKGCSSQIGWVRQAVGVRAGRPHPVQPKGWCGPRVAALTPGAKTGYTRGGHLETVLPQEPGTTIMPSWVTVWESHFAYCAKAPMFRQRARGREE